MATRLPVASLGFVGSCPTSLLNMSLRFVSRVLKFSTPVLPPTMVESPVKFSRPARGDGYVSKGTACTQVYSSDIF
jgi:hypothetical protein